MILQQKAHLSLLKKHDDNLNPSRNSLSIADLYLFKFSNKLTMIYQMYVLSRNISI